MLWTVFMLVMFAWMLGLVLEFRLGAIPLVIVLASIVAFIKLIRRAPFPSTRVGRMGSERN
ncbi:MAG TPA: hypothetical protein VFL42_08545 [Terriglobales bacterium]|nr:hypothetical protein [Terriglobales bacterium]